MLARSTARLHRAVETAHASQCSLSAVATHIGATLSNCGLMSAGAGAAPSGIVIPLPLPGLLPASPLLL